MSLDTSPHLFYARVDPRRRPHAVGMYTHVLDQHGNVYNQPIVLNERQAGVAIQGVIRHNENRDDGGLLRLSVDTHGYTNVGMAVSKLLGFDLCPRLRNLSERKLYLPRAMAAPEGLTAVVAHEISIKAIRDGWKELLRLVASIHAGRVSAMVAVQRFGSVAQGDPVYRPADHLGRLLRTLFLCDYFSNIEFRREMHTLLNRGESVYQLQHAIHTGKIAPERGRRRDEIIAISGSLTLLTNLVIAGPAHFTHVNFRGTPSFPIDLYREMLLDVPLRRRIAGS